MPRIRAVTLDLDDTLWPIWPTLERAERALLEWLRAHAPVTAAQSTRPGAMREWREQASLNLPDLAHDLGALRREAIRLALLGAGEDPALAVPAFEVFFAERQRVELFDDALATLEFLSARYPVVALSNGNADVRRVGLARYFRGAVSMRSVGIGKPHAPIFLAAAQMAGVTPHEVLHVGDDAHLDGLGALDAGMQVAWVNRGGHDWVHEAKQPQVTVGDLASLCRVLQGRPAP